MAMTKTKKTETEQPVIGSWECGYRDDKNKRKQIQLIIDDKLLTIHHGVENIFGGGRQIATFGHWFNEYLYFTATKYFVRYADDSVMAFGEMNDGAVTWEYRFIRIREA